METAIDRAALLSQAKDRLARALAAGHNRAELRWRIGPEFLTAIFEASMPITQEHAEALLVKNPRPRRIPPGEFWFCGLPCDCDNQLEEPYFRLMELREVS
jgi:hypothetical protein